MNIRDYFFFFQQFHKFIENVKPIKQSNDHMEWSVSYSDVVSKEKETKIYDAVIVCNGLVYIS